MNDDEPLPLIPLPDELTFLDPETPDIFNGTPADAYIFVTVTWLLCFVSFCALFLWWRYVIEPLTWSNGTKAIHDKLVLVFLLFERHVISFWCIYIAAWWGAYLRWIGWKMFRHSKGIQS